ncbi:flagellar motor protein MotB [Elusimicrobiota bacterium]
MGLKKSKINVEDDENQWMFSYSDMVTLLFTFFVLLYAISNPDPVKIQLLSNYFSKEKKMTFTELQQKIEEYIVDNKVQQQVAVKLTSKGVEINFKDKVLFDIGKANLKDVAYPILTEIGKLLNYEEITDRKISVEGHTDSIPIRSAVFPSNWELSSARAATVVRFFVGQGMNSRRFESIGYAETRPVVPEIDEKRGLAQNRRVVVVISPESYMADFMRTEIDIKSAPVKLKKEEKTKETAPVKTEEKAVGDSENKAVDKVEMEKYFTAAQTEFKNGNYEEAIEYWNKVLAIDPGHQASINYIKRAQEK